MVALNVVLIAESLIAKIPEPKSQPPNPKKSRASRSGLGCGIWGLDGLSADDTDEQENDCSNQEDVQPAAERGRRNQPKDPQDDEQDDEKHPDRRPPTGPLAEPMPRRRGCGEFRSLRPRFPSRRRPSAIPAASATYPSLRAS